MSKSRTRTVNGYLKLLRKVANIQLMTLKGYADLPQIQKSILGSISADIDNSVGELEKELLDEQQNPKAT